jgi:hypothetical protein
MALLLLLLRLLLHLVEQIPLYQEEPQCKL